MYLFDAVSAQEDSGCGELKTKAKNTIKRYTGILYRYRKESDSGIKADGLIYSLNIETVGTSSRNREARMRTRLGSKTEILVLYL